MEVRSITLFCEPDYGEAETKAFFTESRHHFSLPLQTCRVALPPFPNWWPEKQPVEEQAATVTERWLTVGADYVSVGPVLLEHGALWLEKVPRLLGHADALFASAEVADRGGRIDLARIRAVAEVIRQASLIQSNGFGNLYFTALANCPPGAPFFPTAYHGGGPPSFALALEAADLALEAVSSSATLEEAQSNLVERIEAQADTLSDAAATLSQRHGIAFSGLDFSLAPYPTPGQSLAGALEALGLPWLGAAGSLFAAAFITEAIGRARFPRCGFSGLMLPVLEDSLLAGRAATGKVSVSDLLSYAAVCGVGLDTVPLPGNISLGGLSAILLDMAALASRLDKPLTARLMPLPGLEAGDPVHFDFPYFADSGVMGVPGEDIEGLLQMDSVITLQRTTGGRDQHG